MISVCQRKWAWEHKCKKQKEGSTYNKMIAWCSGKSQKNGREGLRWDGNGQETKKIGRSGLTLSCSFEEDHSDIIWWMSVMDISVMNGSKIRLKLQINKFFFFVFLSTSAGKLWEPLTTSNMVGPSVMDEAFEFQNRLPLSLSRILFYLVVLLSLSLSSVITFGFLSPILIARLNHCTSLLFIICLLYTSRCV